MGNCLVLEDNEKIKMQSAHLQNLHRLKKVHNNKERGTVRIKIVISKQELTEILEKEGLTLEDMMSQIQKKPKYYSHKSEYERSIMWKPALESIPEFDDLQ